MSTGDDPAAPRRGPASQDRAWKVLFSGHPRDTVITLLPDLVDRYGPPDHVEAVQQECPLPDLARHSRFLDIALHCRWRNGRRKVIVLVEHWSEARKVALTRVNWYVADLLLRHPFSEILPCIFVTDHKRRTIPEVLTMGSLWPVLRLQVRVIRIGPDDLPRLRSLRNRVAATLRVLALREIANAVEAAYQTLAAMAATTGPLDDLRRLFPLVMHMVFLSPTQESELTSRLSEDPPMRNIFDEYLEKGKAEGKAEGEAEGMVAVIRDLVETGTLSVHEARGRIRALTRAGKVPAAAGREALRQLGKQFSPS